MKEEKEPIKAEDGIPMPPKSKNPITDPPDPPSPAEESLRKENELLRLQLENAELRAKLAAGSAAPAKIGSPPVGRPMPEHIPAGLPPMPEMDPLQGDKTPALVEWFRDNMPEEFAARYKGRKTHLKKKLQAETDDDDQEEARYKDFVPSSDPSINTSPRLY